MALSQVDRAQKLSDKAVKGFQRAHAKLSKANEMLAQHEVEQRQAAIEWQRQVELAIAQAQENARVAGQLKAKNAKKIELLGDLIA